MGTRIIGILLVLLATSIEAVGQVSLKQSEMVSDAVRSRLWTVFGVACLVVEAIVWTLVLAKLDVSIAFPMGSLCFVMVFILSSLFLKEKPNRSRWTGVFFILSGTALLGSG